MRLTEFLFNIIDKFSPMAELDRNELRKDANNDYLLVKKRIFDDNHKIIEGVNVKTLSLKEKIVYYSEQWPVRTFFALLYIPSLRWIQDFIQPPASDFEEYEDEDDD